MHLIRSSIAALVVIAVALTLASDHGDSRTLLRHAAAAGDPAAGAKVFAENGCAVCHTFTPAKATGKIGPNLDTTKLDTAGAAAVITSGRNVMPSFRGKLSASQIADVAAYVTGSGKAPAAPAAKPAPTPKPKAGPAARDRHATIPIGLTDTRLTLPRRTIEPATVTLVVRNAGTRPHALVVARVTPTVRLVATFPSIGPKTSVRRTVKLAAGSYMLTASRGGVTGPRMLTMLTVRSPKGAAAPPPTPAPAPTTPGPGAGGADAPGRTGDATNGARLFAALGCGSCHTFAPAGSTGTVGPNLGVSRPSAARISSMLNLGGSVMPSFATRASQQDIADIAAYLTSANGGGSGTTPPGGTTATTGGAQIFAAMGCGGCHTLTAAGARGAVGPNLDTLRPSQNQVVAMVTAGGGVMPAFGGRLTTSQILEVAAYVSSVAGTGASGGGGSAGGGGGATATGPIGLVLFQRGGCGACHTLAAARTTGTVGPDLDDERPDRDKVVKILMEGKDSMPSFATVFSRTEMQEIGAWIESVTDR